MSNPGTTLPSANQETNSKERTRPTKILPSDRITFIRQLDILRAWGAASGPNRKVVNNGDVAEIVKMQASTVSLANAFFVNNNLLLRTDTGGYVPAEEVISFLRAYEWSPETAASKLAPIISKAWFAEELLPRLSFAAVSFEEAVQLLADAAAASPDYRKQVELLLDYLANTGLIEIDGNQVRKGKGATTVQARSAPEAVSTKTEAPQQEASAPRAAVPSLFGTTEGAVNFHVSVRVEMSEFANWKPERIAAFFSGIAQVLAAKADVEKEK